MENGIQSKNNSVYDKRLKEISLGIFERKMQANLSNDEKKQLKRVFKGENYLEHGGELIKKLDLRLTLIWDSILNQSLKSNYENIQFFFRSSHCKNITSSSNKNRDKRYSKCIWLYN